MSKEACVVVIDVGKSMGNSVDGEISGLEKAKKALRLMIQQKLLFTKRDEMGIVLLGTEGTANALHEETGGYDHVTVEKMLQLPDLKLLEYVDSIDVQDSQGDVVDSILVAMGLIKDRVKKLKFSKRIFVITDAAGDMQADPEQLDVIAQGMIDDDFKLNIIGLGFSDGDDEKQDNKGRTKIQVQNEEVLRAFTDKVAGAVFPLSEAIDMLSFFRSRSVNQVTKLRGDLEISDAIKIPVYSYAKTATQNLPSLKKQSLVAKESEAEGGTYKVKQARNYFNKKADGDGEVPPEQRIRAFKYGKTFVPFADPEALKWETVKCIKVLGFCPAKTIQRYEYMSGSDIIVAEPGNVRAGKALSAFVHACHELEWVVIVRYVKRKNAQPLRGVLIPVVKASMEGFYYNQLPCIEDVRLYQFGSFEQIPGFTPSKSQLDAARALVSSMDLMTAALTEDGSRAEALKPKQTFNPVLQRFYQCVERRALDSSAPVEELDPLIAKYVQPDESMLKAAAPALDNFKKSFPLQRVEAKKKEKRHWRDYLEAEFKAAHDGAMVDTDIALAAKRVRGDDEKASQDGSVRMEDIMTRQVDTVGAANPIEDFKAIMKRHDRNDLIVKAMKEMVELIKSEVMRSFGSTSYPKAIECLDVLRVHCVQETESDKFNNALKELQVKFARDKPDFWNMVQDKGLYPIDTSDDPHSRYTPEQAKAFFGAPASLGASVDAPRNDANDDDVLGALE